MKHSITLDQYAVSFGSLSETANANHWQSRYSAIFLLTDTNTHQYCTPVFWEKTSLSPDIPQCIIPAGESHKHLQTCEQIWSAMLEHRLDRKALMINLGGGVIGDMGGFCAATFKRGIDFIQVPTTLLSATDASVGGKLGVDFQSIKNIIGVFQDPQAVLIDTDFFHTLNPRERLSGFAEMIKHACIHQGLLWDAIASIQDLDMVDWAGILPPSVEVKARVVQQDPKEQGLRAVLNFGHTIGHAIESYFLHTSTPLTHGEAISIGMLWEGFLAEQKSIDMGVRLSTLQRVIQRHFKPELIQPEILDAIWLNMQQDKKNERDQVRAVVPGREPYTMSSFHLTRVDLDAALSSFQQV